MEILAIEKHCLLMCLRAKHFHELVWKIWVEGLVNVHNIKSHDVLQNIRWVKKVQKGSFRKKYFWFCNNVSLVFVLFFKESELNCVFLRGESVNLHIEKRGSESDLRDSSKISLFLVTFTLKFYHIRSITALKCTILYLQTATLTEYTVVV